MNKETADIFQFEWFNKLLVNDLGPHWVDAAVTESGLFHPHLNRKWERTGEHSGTLVSQSRLLFVFSEAYRQTGENRYLDAVRKGGEFLLNHFKDREYGGYFAACAPDGSVLDDRKRSYGHAFVLFGMSYAWEVTGDGRFLDCARDAFNTIHSDFLDGRGGICQIMSRMFEDTDNYRNQNPVMHLTEALLVLARVSGDQLYLDKARYWIDFLFTPMVERGDIAMLEFYDLNWIPLSEEDRPKNEPGVIVIGHQLEWAFLISFAVELGLPESYLDYGSFVLEAGLNIGYDSEYGGLMCKADGKGKVCQDKKGFWEQAETIRALANYILCHGRQDLQQVMQKSISFFQTYQFDNEFGGVYPDVTRDGRVLSEKKGGNWKVDYHTCAMITELLRLQKKCCF